jgi:hypothetical protein
LAARVEPGHLVQLDSALSPRAPTFPLTYTLSDASELGVRFEMALSGASAAYRQVALGTLKRPGA